MEHYRYILKVAEELLYNACPPELIQKYEMLKQISLSKASHLQSSNGDTNGSLNYQNSHQTSQQQQNQTQISERFCLQLLESMMECVGLFLDVFDSINNESMREEHKLKECSNRIGEFNEITSKIVIAQQQKQMQIKELHITKNIYSFDKITSNMVRALYDFDNCIANYSKKINQQSDLISNQQQQLKKINIEFEISTQRSIQKQHLENNELIEKNKNLILENDTLIMQLNEKKKYIDRLEIQLESQNIKMMELQSISDSSRMRILNLEKDLQEKSLEFKSMQNHISLDVHHKKIDEFIMQINNVTKQSAELNHFYKTFKDEFNIYINKYTEAYDEFQKKNNPSILSDEKLNLLLFIAYLFQKFEGDNMWLVERLTEFGKDNDHLKQQNETMYTEVHYLKNSLKNSSSLDNLSVQLQREIEMSSKQLNLYNDSKHKLKEFLLQSENKTSQHTNQSQI